jgi:hypothetical protein
MKREAEATWASERVENALLRERINDVAAEVARLTSVLEGPARRSTRSSRAEHAPARTAGKPAVQPANTNSEDGKGSLADRIRALQARSRGYPPRRDCAAPRRFLAA